MNTLKLTGILPALTTCFDHSGRLYRAKVLHNIERLNAIALSGYVVCGSTGETPFLSAEERLQLIAWVREASAEKKILIAGTGSESVSEAIRFANQAANIGYHAVLVLPPFYYRAQMTKPQIHSLFFRAVADQSKLPVLLYNIPQVMGYALAPETVAVLAEHPNIIGMKDSSGDLENLRKIIAAVPEHFQVLSGAGVNFRNGIELGAKGAILAIANAIPYACVTVWEAMRTREHDAARDWAERMLPAAKAIAAQYGIPGLKYAMDLNGYYGGPPRLPFTPPGPADRAAIEAAFVDLRS